MTPDQLAHDLNRLANKAINRVALGVGMTELMPEDVRLLQDAAEALARMDSSERIARSELAALSREVSP